MVRTILKPEKNSLTIKLPDDLVGKMIEVIAFSIEETKVVTKEGGSKSARIKALNSKLKNFKSIVGATNSIVMTQTTTNKIAVDTNILLYALDDFYPDKQSAAIEIIADRPIFSSQNLSEFSNVCLRRWKFHKLKVADLIKTLLEQCQYVPVTEHILLRSFDVIKKYDFQLFDAMIVASALESDCEILYSEDMHHNLLVDKQLKIINPFL